MTRHACLLLAAPLVLLFTRAAAADGPQQVAADERKLQAANLKHDGPALLEFFHKRTLTDLERANIELLIQRLGSRAFRAREQAATDLVARGPVIVELLKAHLKDNDPEIARRAEKCIERIKDKDLSPDVSMAAVRLLAARKPAGAAAALLAYLPYADNEGTAEEVRNGLAALAVRDGKPEKVLVEALSDRNPVRRGAAGEALARARVAAQKPALEKLLKDPDVAVRFRVALALTLSGERNAVPELIALLETLPQTLAWQAEDVLCRLADGKDPPAVSLGTEPAARKECRAAWDKWWTQHGSAVNLAKLRETPPLQGYTILVLLDLGRVLEVDAEKRVRWQVDGLTFPLDVQYLPSGRILVAEYHASRITERDVKTGAIRWQHMIAGPGPLVAQRLPNGNTFIATEQQMFEVDQKGKEVFTCSLPNERIMKAMKLANGEMVCLAGSEGPPFGRMGPVGPIRVVRLSNKGKVLKSFPVALGMRLSGGRIHMLPNGRVLVPHNAENKVVEYDINGKAVWQVEVEQPVAATRLPNGHTLVTTMTQNRAVEFDRSGHEVWQYRSNTRVTRAIRR